jgi:uncharacterized protein (TIGR02246 family)
MTQQVAARDGIESGYARLRAGFQQRDAAAIASCYHADARIFPPGGDMQSGREAITAFWRRVIDTGLTDIALTPTEVHELGECAFETGTYRLWGADRRPADHGKYLVVWKLEGGVWRLFRDIWNTSVAPPAK